jgi:hypothetical protein
MTTYCALQKKPEDYVLEFLHRQPAGQKWCSIEYLMHEEVLIDALPQATRRDYEQAISRLIAMGRVVSR